MPTHKLHRLLFLGMVVTIGLLALQLVLTTTRMNRLERRLDAIETSVDDMMEFAKEAAGRESLLLERQRAQGYSAPNNTPGRKSDQGYAH